jgi:hypothetical protein
MLSIWFFIGVLLLAYGILIFGAGVLEWSNPAPVVRYFGFTAFGSARRFSRVT